MTTATKEHKANVEAGRLELATDVRQRLAAIRRAVTFGPRGPRVTRTHVRRVMTPLQDAARELEQAARSGRKPKPEAHALIGFGTGQALGYLRDLAAEDASERFKRPVDSTDAPEWPHELCEWTEHYATELWAAFN